MQFIQYVRIFAITLILFTLAPNIVQAQRINPNPYTEEILSFDSEIHVKPDNTLLVTETITVNVLHKNIKHGIYRDFPTTYTYLKAFKTKRGFKIISIKRDDKPEPYHTEWLGNGTREYI